MRLQQETLGSSILMTAPCRMGLSGHLVWYASKRSVQLILFLIFNLENYLFAKASPGRGSWSEEPCLPCPQYRAWTKGISSASEDTQRKGMAGLLSEEPSS